MKFQSLSFFFASLFMLYSSEINAQSPDWLWAKSIGGIGFDYGFSIAVDAYANVYTTGVFDDTMDFDPGVGVFNLIPVAGNDIFISKLDSSGNFVWAKRFGGISSDWGLSITTDALGDVFATGEFYDTVDFDPGPGIFNLSGIGDVFILKLDGAGNFIYAKSMGNPIGSDVSGSIIVDDNGNVYTTGRFGGTGDFDPGPATYNLTASGGTVNVFISKLDSIGNFVWAKQLDGEFPSWGNFIAIDKSDNLCISGYFEGTGDFDPGPSTFNLISTGYRDIFIAKLDSGGNFIWAKQMGGAMNVDEANSIATDDLNNIYTTGIYKFTSDFDPDPATNLFFTSKGWEDIFITKLGSSGNLIWAKTIGGIFYDKSYSLALDNYSNLYITGYFGDTVDFDPGAGVFNLIAPGASSFVLKLDSSGNFIWAKAMVPATVTLQPSFLGLDNSDKVYVMGGFYQDTAIFGTNEIYNSSLSGWSDVYVAKLNNVFTGLEESSNLEASVFIFPNPATDYFFINLTDNRQKYYQITISDIAGKIIYNSTNSEVQNTKISISEFRSGLYFVQIKSPDFVVTNKLVIEN